MAVDLVTIHHQGGGAPNDNFGGFSGGGYSYGLGKTRWERFRSPYVSYATLNFNHVSLDICLSGSRGNTNPAYPVTDTDIQWLNQVFMDCYGRGEVTANPLVRAHRNSPGSSTACPGDNTMARWGDVVNACRAGAQPQPPKPPEPEDDVTDLASAINHDGRPVVVQVGGDKRLYFKIRDAVGGGWGKWRDLSQGFGNFATCTAFVNPNNKAINVWVTMVDGKSFQTWQVEPDFATWSGWQDQTL